MNGARNPRNAVKVVEEIGLTLLMPFVPLRVPASNLVVRALLALVFVAILLVGGISVLNGVLIVCPDALNIPSQTLAVAAIKASVS